MSERRSSVVNSSTVGKAEKSSGLAALSATISTASEITMLVMKPRSSMIAGIGTTISATSISDATGRIAPRLASIHTRLLIAVIAISHQTPRLASMR